jgi:acylphosphatase
MRFFSHMGFDYKIFYLPMLFRGMKVRAVVRFYGRVQGVFFRANTREKARELGVAGWVQNLPDGTVRAVMEGAREAVEKLIVFCEHQIPGARVTRKDVAFEEPEGLQGFVIKYGW